MGQTTGPLSPLDALKLRREELVQATTTVIKVPGWDGALSLRIHPVEHATFRASGMRIERAKAEKKARAEIVGAAAVIAEAIDAILLAGADGQPEDYDLMSSEFVAAMGLDPARASETEIIEAMCLGRQGAMLALSRMIAEHSGYAEEAADEDFAGE